MVFCFVYRFDFCIGLFCVLVCCIMLFCLRPGCYRLFLARYVLVLFQFCVLLCVPCLTLFCVSFRFVCCFVCCFVFCDVLIWTLAHYGCWLVCCFAFLMFCVLSGFVLGVWYFRSCVVLFCVMPCVVLCSLLRVVFCCFVRHVVLFLALLLCM